MPNENTGGVRAASKVVVTVSDGWSERPSRGTAHQQSPLPLFTGVLRRSGLLFIADSLLHLLGRPAGMPAPKAEALKPKMPNPVC